MDVAIAPTAVAGVGEGLVGHNHQATTAMAAAAAAAAAIAVEAMRGRCGAAIGTLDADKSAMASGRSV